MILLDDHPDPYDMAACLCLVCLGYVGMVLTMIKSYLGYMVSSLKGVLHQVYMSSAVRLISLL